mgnify:CR=1 FL=1
MEEVLKNTDNSVASGERFGVEGALSVMSGMVTKTMHSHII